jgi:adenine-specific DNA-methyltransferase
MGTSYIDNLLSKVEDESVRTQLTNEINKLRDNKEFGLVFERHIPEYVRLYKRKITEGAHVQLKSSKSDDIFTVREIKGKKVKIADKDEKISEKKLDELVVVIRHGDSIYPGLVEVDRVERGGDKPFHTVINAENYHALQLLLYTHEGKIDCIYIDPPYNTGARDWKYNNDYVDSEDRYRHSKWLSFMEKRLLLAKRLLKPDGVMIVTIDEHEVSRLGLLLENLFASARIQKCTIVNNAAGVTQGGLARVEEYAFFCWFGSSIPCKIEDDFLSNEGKDVETPVWFSFTRYGGIDDTPEKRPKLVYPVLVDPKENRIEAAGLTMSEMLEKKLISKIDNSWRPPIDKSSLQRFFDADIKSKHIIWPYRGDGILSRWQGDRELLMRLQSEGFVRLKTTKNGSGGNKFTMSYVKSGNRQKVLSGKIKILGNEKKGGAYILGKAPRETIAKTVWKRASHDAGKWGSRTIRDLLGTVNFTYAKSPYAVLDCLRVVCDNNPDALILDFFGGSGTTAHSVAMLNKLDNGRRKCILVTNNQVEEKLSNTLIKSEINQGSTAYEENGIFYATTIPRLIAAISGKRDGGETIKGKYNKGSNISDGFEENMCFLELDFLEYDSLARGNVFEKISRILWLISGAHGSVIDGISDTFSLQKEGNYAILYNISHWQEFIDEVKQKDTMAHAFIITDSKVQYQQVVKHLPSNIETTMLYEDYLRNFQIGV